MRSMKVLLAALSGPLALTACGAATSPAAPAAPSPEVRAPAVVVEEQLAAPLAPLGLTGVIAWKEHGEAAVHCSERAGCEARTVPASTFKIANALIALDAGLVAGPEESFPWDGVRRSLEGWNRDHTLRSAFEASSLPVFQGIARRVGLDRFRSKLAQFSYGNGQIGEKVDTFWLDGPLGISPIEQLAFLERLEGKALPVREEAREGVRDILVRERRGDAVLRGKTGWAAPGSPDELGWFVGYASQGPRVVYVAVRVKRLPGTDDKAFFQGRMEAAKRTLEALGAYGAPPSSSR
jgi:beta-lactamase class D